MKPSTITADQVANIRDAVQKLREDISSMPSGTSPAYHALVQSEASLKNAIWSLRDAVSALLLKEFEESRKTKEIK